MPSEITAAVCGVLALFCLIVSVMQFMEKGPLVNNAWIWATRKEREAMDKKLHYRQPGVVFAFLSVIFFCIALECVLLTGWLFPAAGGLSVAVIIYAFASSARDLGSGKY